MASPIRFCGFELNGAACELRRGSRTLKLERLAMDLLLLLVNHRDRVVTREEIFEKLWGKNTFLDAENGINTAVRKIRRTLGDNPERPRFLRTVPGRGYQFIAPISFAAAEERVTFVVLPFQNIGHDPSHEYVADGLTEETIATLAAIDPEHLAVLARTTSMVYKNTRKSIRQIGRELGADYILESSVRVDGGRIRITVQLIRVRGQTHVWAESYEREFRGVLTIQAELGKAIAQQVSTRVPARRLEAPPARTASADAYDLYLRGRYYFAQRTRPATYRAIEYFERALQVDGEFSAANAALADAYVSLPITADVPTGAAAEKALPAAEKAVVLDGTSAEAHTAVAACRFWLQWDWDGAITAAQRAISANPNYPLAHFFLAHTYSNLGRHEDAEKAVQQAIRLDPFSVHLHAIHGQMLFQARRFEDAAAQARTALSLKPDSWLAHNILGKVQVELGDLDDALVSLQHALELAGSTSEPLSLKAYVLSKQGDRAGAEEILKTMHEIRRQRYLPLYNTALVHMALGEKENAVRCLRQSFEERDVRMLFLALDPKWDELNCDPRVRALWPQPPDFAARAQRAPGRCG